MTTQTIRNLVAQILTECDAIDAGSTPPPSTPPAIIDCLAGTVPPATNMYSDELNEAAWIQKRATYRTTMKNAASGSIVCLGDSMIEYMNVANISAKAVNLGISGESIRQLIYRVNETDIDNQPNLIHRAGAVVILTGVNDLSDARNGTQANAAATVNFVYDRLSGWLTGKVVICKLIPVDSAIFSIPSNTAGIGAVNAWIDTEFGGRQGFAIVDVTATLAPNGSLLPQYHNGDGQHLNAAGNQVLQDAIKTKLTSLGVVL